MSAGQARKGGSRKPMPDLVRRQIAIAATMRRFAGRNFKLGKTDCLILFRAHAVAMGRKMPRVPEYRSKAGAMNALSAQLERLGGDPGGDLGDLLDALGLERIAPAAALGGDVVLLDAPPQADAWQAMSLGIFVGPKFLGWHVDTPVLAVQQPIVERPFLKAWRL